MCCENSLKELKGCVCWLNQSAVCPALHPLRRWGRWIYWGIVLSFCSWLARCEVALIRMSYICSYRKTVWVLRKGLFWWRYFSECRSPSFRRWEVYFAKGLATSSRNLVFGNQWSLQWSGSSCISTMTWFFSCS